MKNFNNIAYLKRRYFVFLFTLISFTFFQAGQVQALDIFTTETNDQGERFLVSMTGVGAGLLVGVPAGAGILIAGGPIGGVLAASLLPPIAFGTIMYSVMAVAQAEQFEPFDLLTQSTHDLPLFLAGSVMSIFSIYREQAVMHLEGYPTSEDFYEFVDYLRDINPQLDSLSDDAIATMIIAEKLDEESVYDFLYEIRVALIEAD